MLSALLTCKRLSAGAWRPRDRAPFQCVSQSVQRVGRFAPSESPWLLQHSSVSSSSPRRVNFSLGSHLVQSRSEDRRLDGLPSELPRNRSLSYELGKREVDETEQMLEEYTARRRGTCIWPCTHEDLPLRTVCIQAEHFPDMSYLGRFRMQLTASSRLMVHISTGMDLDWSIEDEIPGLDAELSWQSEDWGANSIECRAVKALLFASTTSLSTT